MKLGQLKWNGAITAAIFNCTSARPIPEYTLYDLICRAEKEGTPLSQLAEDLSIPKPVPAAPVIPLQPREVWGCGSTYETSASFRDGQDGILYGRAHREDRPQIFFKGTARVCVGPGQPIGIRSDSNFTAPEPELALVLGARGRILGYTLANDVSAWDIERDNPLYLAQSKTFSACCALGPVIITADEIDDPHNLTVSCRVTRDGETIFTGEASTARLRRTMEDLVEFLMRANPVPAGSILLTGTGVIVGEEGALAAGDSVTIGNDRIGELTNQASIVGLPVALHAAV